MSDFSIRKIENWQQWDTFNAQSPQGSLFSSSSYLRAAGRPFHCYWICKGEHPKAAFIITPAIHREDVVELDDLIIYGGILFNDDRESNPSKLHARQFQLTEAVVTFLTGCYSRVELAMSPQFEDLRPFLWHQYHHADPRQRFVADLRYTGYLDIAELSDPGSEQSLVFANMAELRKRNIREAQKSQAKVCLETGCGKFMDFYRAMMAKQGEDVASDKQERMVALIESLLAQDRALMSACYDSDGKLLYLSVFGWDDRRAYYLFGAGNPEMNTRYQGTFCFWESFKILAGERSIRQVDLEGVNSPQRGQFKMSFGAELIPYYQLYWRPGL